METVDFSKEPSAHESNLVVLTFLKIEIALAVLFIFESSIDLSIVLAGVCAIVNQLTEIYYLRKSKLRQKLLVLLKSLLVTFGFYTATFLIHINFIYQRHGETKIDTNKIGLLAKLLAIIFALLAAMRLLAVWGDLLINRYEQKKKLK